MSTQDQDPTKLALYFGCLHNGHHLHHPTLSRISSAHQIPFLPWDEALMDTGLLKNGKHPDVVDGKVFWTCGGRSLFWIAFIWWDRSGDDRSNSHSGFYVRGFELAQIHEAFEYAMATWPQVIARQKCRLVLQGAGAIGSARAATETAT